MMKWAVTVALCAIASATASGAHAQTDPSPGTWPNKPVRIIVDSAPGSATDVAARLMADRLANVWGG
jgi:tripartite-type tricarboxylate transporter receptor subunit TctC